MPEGRTPDNAAAASPPAGSALPVDSRSPPNGAFPRSGARFLACLP